jgi:DNA-binding IclR family transcriptional regulator
MHDAEYDESGKRIKSVERAFTILELIRDREEVGVTELAADLDCAKSTVHHYTKTLEALDYLENDDGQYRLGIRLLGLGGPARANQQLYQLAKDDVDEIAAETGEQARLIAEQNGYGITLYQSAGENISEPYGPLGSIEHLHCTAAGKAFLAELAPERAGEFIDNIDFVAYTENTITDPEQLVAELDAIRERGVAFDDEERYEGVRCVATAVTSKTDEPYGAISVAGATDRMNGERYHREIPDLIQNVAGVVEVNTAYSDWAERSHQ